MDGEPPSIDHLLGRLPWFGDLTREHRGEMLSDLAARLVVETTRDEFIEMLETWQTVAHMDAKWSRFGLLRMSGVLEPPPAQDG